VELLLRCGLRLLCLEDDRCELLLLLPCRELEDRLLRPLERTLRLLLIVSLSRRSFFLASTPRKIFCTCTTAYSLRVR